MQEKQSDAVDARVTTWAISLVIVYILYFFFLGWNNLFYRLILLILAAPFLVLVFRPVYFVCRSVYFLFKPEAKQRYLQRLEREAAAEEQRKAAENLRREEEKRHKEEKRRLHRDADSQDEPYKYKIGRHANETLAIRYGIANREKEVVPYYYYAKGGEQRRNYDRDKVRWKDAKYIKLQKVKKLKLNRYEVLLSDFRNRKAIAIIEPGTEYVKTFYPKEPSWFQRHADLEEVLKGNSSMTLKELAHFHVHKAVGIGEK